MNFEINPTNIDIVIAIVMIIMLVFGFFRGFVYRAYDLLATFVALFGALYLAPPLAQIYTIYQVEGLGEVVGQYVNRFIIFIVLLIVIKIVLLLIGKLVKPLLKNAVYLIPFFKQFDQFLGAIVSGVEGIIMIYLALSFIVLPVVPNGKENVEQTVLAKHILAIVPSIKEEIYSLDVVNDLINQGFNHETYDASSIYGVTKSLNTAYDSGVISLEDLDSTLNKYYQDIDSIGQIMLSQSQYDELVALLAKTNIDQTRILNKMVVSE